MKAQNFNLEKKEFSTLEICRSLKIPRERLREWMVRGFIRPSIREAKGTGTRAIFSRGDVYGVSLFKRLIEGGLSRERAGEYVNVWLASYGNLTSVARMAAARYIIFRRYLKKDGKTVIDIERLGISSHMDWKINLDRGATVYTNIGTTREPDHNWDDVLIINFAKIIEDTDSALS